MLSWQFAHKTQHILYACSDMPIVQQWQKRRISSEKSLFATLVSSPLVQSYLRSAITSEWLTSSLCLFRVCKWSWWGLSTHGSCQACPLQLLHSINLCPDSLCVQKHCGKKQVQFISEWNSTEKTTQFQPWTENHAVHTFSYESIYWYLDLARISFSDYPRIGHQ